MSQEIQYPHTAAAATLYAVVRNAAGSVWNGAAFVSYATADIDDYAIAMTEQGTASQYYTATFPAAARGIYHVTIYLQGGGSPAEGDTRLDSFTLEWDGSAVQFTPAADSSGRVTVISNQDKTGYGVSSNSDKTGYSLAVSPPTASAIATAVWQDATAGDFTVASSIGKALYVANIVPGASGGHFIAGSNAATTISGLTTGALSCTTITASGAVAFQSTFAVTTSTSLAALSCTTLTASGAVALQSTVTVTGTTTLAALTTGAVSHTTLTCSGAVAFQSTFAVTTSTSLAALSCTTLTASGAVAFQSTFAVTTSTSLAALSCTTLTVSGAVALQSTVTVTGATSLAALSTSGTTTLSALTVTNATTFSGAVSLGSTLGVTGAATFAAITAAGTVTFNALTVTNATTLHALAATTVTISGAVALQSTLAVTGTTTLTGAVSATNVGNNIAGVALGATSLNAIVPADPSAKPVLGTANIVTLIGWLSAWSLNEVDVTSGDVKLRNSADSGNLATHALADNGTTFVSSAAS